MSVASDLRYRLRAVFRRRAMEAELAAELEHHVMLQAARYEASGMAAGEARRRALLDLGGVELVKERSRDVRGTSTLDLLMRDLRYAVRSLLRAPAFTLAAVVALGLGIGSATAVFSMLHGVVLRPLPYAEPARLVSLWETNAAKGLDHELMSPVNFTDYASLGAAFSDAAGWWRTQLVLDDHSGADPVRVPGIEVTSNFFTLLGVAPALGHGFDGDSLLRVPSQQVMISDRLWRTKFGGRADVVGKTVALSGTDYTVAGVMPAAFDFPEKVDLWLGLTWTLTQHSRGAHFWEGIARLAPGVSEAQANRVLAAKAARLAAMYPATNAEVGVRAVRLDREIVGPFRPALFALMGASALLLLIACINVANLLLARGTARRREVALRSAIGAGRAQLVRMLLTESLLLAAAGTVVGLAVASVGVRALLAWSPIAIPRAADIGVNGWVLLAAIAAAVLTAVGFGLAPALATSRVQPIDAMRNGSAGAGSRSKGVRGVLVVAEVALAVMLLSGASLLVRSVSRLLHEDIGADPAGAVTAEVQLQGASYATWPSVNQFHDRLLGALRARGDITAAGLGYYLPLDVAYRMRYGIAGAPAPASGVPETAQYHSIDEGFLAALGSRMLAGRPFAATDGAETPPVAIVNETFAKRHFPAGGAVGQRIVTDITNVGPLGARIVAGTEHEIVGVVADIRNTSLRDATEPAIFFASRQFPYRAMKVVLRGRGDVPALAAALREEVRRIDRGVVIGEVRPMEAVLASSIDTPRLLRMLLGVFALAALTLAAVGIYGILTYTVVSRRREVAVRIALGARPRAILGMVVREGIVLAAAGFAAGVAGMAIAGRSLESFLFGVTAWDPASMIGVLSVVMVVAATACFLPGWRASREDPARALRAE